MLHINEPSCICKQISYSPDNNACVLIQRRKAGLYEALETKCHAVIKCPSSQGLAGLWQTKYYGRTEKKSGACQSIFEAGMKDSDLMVGVLGCQVCCGGRGLLSDMNIRSEA
jgi:hypothetical protein